MAAGAVPRERAAAIVEPHITLNYTTVLNIVFLALAAVLLVRFFRTNGLAMLRMMNEIPKQHGAIDQRTRGEADEHVTDPVCGMSISSRQAPETVEHRGHRFYFCSENCRRRFEANPERYSRQPA
jgi:YHS domain-containing protein